MPGPAFHFTVLKKTIDELIADGDSRGKIMSDHSNYAYLGAFGPDLLMHNFIDDENLLQKIEKVLNGNEDPNTWPLDEKLSLHRNLLMLSYSSVFKKLQELWPLLQEIHTFLDKMDGIAAAEDTDALKNMQDEIDAIKNKMEPLKNTASSGSSVQDAFSQIISLFRPNIQADSATASYIQTTEMTWRLWEFLRWRGSGRMARKMVGLAKQESGTKQEQLLAYAYGYMNHIATAVTCAPFINNIVGGPYRTHWWRKQYVRNYIDVWTWGRYNTAGAKINGNEPSPAYQDWNNLCCIANLQDKIKMPSQLKGADAVSAVVKGEMPQNALPDFLANFLAKAVNESYSVMPLPPGVFSAETFHNGYVGSFAVLWFMTSGQMPMCIEPLGAPPGDCTEPPSWVTSGGSPPSAGHDEFVDTGKTASAAVLAILALLAFLTGQWVAGLAAVAGIIGLAASGFVKWDELRCHLYWLRYNLYEKENAIREGLIWATMAYPMTRELGTIGADGKTLPATDTSGNALCRTRESSKYPLRMDFSSSILPDLFFARYPQSGLEEPATTDWPQPGDYPDVAVDGAAWVPSSDDMTINDYSTNFPAKKVVGGSTSFFGNAVLNTKAVIKKDAQGLVDYNLDADRGYGWMEWKHKFGTFPSDPPVDEKKV